MDFITGYHEAVAFSIDAFLLSVSYWNYRNLSYTLKQIKRAEEIGVNPDPDNLTDADKKCVIVRGSVVPLEEPLINSLYVRRTTGVIQKITITEHVISKGVGGFWVNNKNVVQEIVNTIPFGLKDRKYQIEVYDAKDAFILDLDTVATQFEPSKSSFMDCFIGFFAGSRQRGVETTEEMLRDGTILTGIGEITKCGMKNTLSEPSDGSAYILTVMPLQSLVRKLKSEQAVLRWLSIVLGSVGICLLGLLIRRGWRKASRILEERAMRKRVDETRRIRKAAARDDEEIPEAMQCVVCRINPREVALLPCGHICLCADCSELIRDLCPMCRATINSKTVVYY